MVMKEKFRKMHRQLQNMSIKTLWIISFTVIIIFCVLGMAIGNAYVKISTDRIIENYNYELMTERIINIDNRITDIFNGIRNISNIHNYEDIIQYNETLSTDRRIRFGQFCRDMDSVAVNGDMTVSKFIYLTRQDCIIGDGVIKKAQSYYSMKYPKGDYEKWRADVLNSGKMLAWDSENGMLYISSAVSDGEAVIFMALSSESIFSDAGDYVNSDFIICDTEQNQIFSLLGNNYNDMIKQLDFSWKAKKCIMGDLAVSYQGVIGYDLNYISVTDLKLNVAALTKARNIMILCVFASIAVGILLGYIFIRKNNSYINEIFNLITPDNELESNNEYMHISSAIHKLILQNGMQTKQLYLHEKKLKNNIINTLLLGESTLDEMKTELEGYNIHIDKKYAALAEASLYDCEYMFFEKAVSMEENTAFAKTIITNVYSDLFEDKYTLYCASNGKRRILLLFLFDDLKNAMPDIKCILQNGNDLIKKQFNIDFKIYFSEAHKSKSDIKKCNKDILRIKEYRTADDTWFIDASELNKIKNQGEYYNYPAEFERTFIRNIKRGRVDDAVKDIDRIFELNNEACLSVRMIRILSMNIANTIVKNSNLLNKHIEKFYYLFNNFCEKITNVSSTGEIKEDLKSLVAFVCSSVKVTNVDVQDKIVEEIKKYVQENYSDTNLNVNSVAMKFCIKVSTLSTMFKKSENIGLGEYITGVRLEAAKHLIETTDYSLRLICEKTGFTSERTFYRVFEKHFEKKPSDFR